jgi:hypothetical protein
MSWVLGITGIEAYKASYLDPLAKEIKSLVKQVEQVKQGASRQDVVHYMIAKHGLERNALMASRESAEWLKDQLDALSEQLNNKSIIPAEFSRRKVELETEASGKFGKKDYSGLSGLMEVVTGEKGGDFTAFAKDLVAGFEKGVDTSGLWKRVNAATKETLRKVYESGLVSRDAFEHISGMYKYYIPLRGWDETTAGDVYEYFWSRSNKDVSVVKEAKGRSSLADDPIALIANMSGNAIMSGERNVMKQHFLNMVINHPSDLATVRKAWYENNGTEKKPNWVISFPSIPANAKAGDVADAMKAHEARMAELEKEGRAKRKVSGIKVDYKIQPSQVNEHIVHIKRNGEDYMVFINGNPKAAQALNGLFDTSEKNVLLDFYTRVKRLYGSGLTSYSPDFLSSNFVRDSFHATSITYLKDGPMAALRFLGNVPESVKTTYRGVKGKYNPNNERDVFFKEFVEHGGETGYISDNSIEYWKEYLGKGLGGYTKLKAAIDKGKIPVEMLGSVIEAANRIMEDATRFNAYYTARKGGKDIAEAIDDAKNISVNFNKKGAGYKAGGVWGAFAGFMQHYMLFWNPQVQGTYQILNVGSRNKARFTKILAFNFAAGFLMPYLNEILVNAYGDDDDDYWKQNAFTRRTNFMLYIPKTGYIKLPMAPFFREIYGLGEIAYGFMNGRVSTEDAAIDSFSQIRSAFSMEGQNGDWDVAHFMAPDLFDPMMDIAANKNFFGEKIARHTDYNALDPEHTRVFKGVHPAYVSVSRALNSMGGGDDVSRSEYMTEYINPAYMQHLITTYTGGVGKTVSNITGMVVDAVNGNTDNIRFKDVPIANRLFSVTGKQADKSDVNRKYNELFDLYKKIKHDYTGYEKKVDEGLVGYQKKIDELENNGYLDFIYEMEYYIKDVNDIYKELDDAPDKEELIQELNSIKKQAVDEYEDALNN